jgi:peptidoglycan/xylan/chitin deacetylase (PgdA/CDA1 family)
MALVASAAGVDVPALPPPGYGAMSWDEVRRLESDLVAFGPHTRHHPILSQVGDTAARDEISGSWADLRRECRNPAPVFCYPDGRSDAFGDREMQLITESGLAGALAVYDGYVEPTLSAPYRFRLPRFPFPDDPTTAAFQASGLARLAPR